MLPMFHFVGIIVSHGKCGLLATILLNLHKVVMNGRESVEYNLE